jgi:hypothetical protein
MKNGIATADNLAKLVTHEFLKKSHHKKAFSISFLEKNLPIHQYITPFATLLQASQNTKYFSIFLLKTFIAT